MKVGESGYNFESLSWNANHFAQATGINCGVFLFDAAKSFECRYCRHISGLLGSQFDCYALTVGACREAARFGGKYIYVCKSGLIHFIAAIKADDVVFGGILGGPVLLEEHGEFLEHETHLSGLDANENLMSAISEIAVISPARLNSLCEILYRLAEGEDYRNTFRKEREMLTQQSVISDYISELKVNPIKNYPELKERELLRAIEEGERTTAGKLLNEVLGYIYFSSGGDFTVIRARVLELIVLLSRSAVRGGADTEKIFGLSYQYQQELHSFKNLDELTFWLSGVMLRFSEHVFRFNGILHRDTMKKAVRYMEKNYMNRISLDDIAKEVCLSPAYFSRLFAKEMNCTFSEYLNKVRVWHAKNLLLSNNLPLADIAQLVGFDDQSYFSKVFKKEVKITPLKFRERRC